MYFLKEDYKECYRFKKNTNIFYNKILKNNTKSSSWIL